MTKCPQWAEKSVNNDEKYGTFEENLEFVLDRIRNHALGAVWILPQIKDREEVMKKIKEKTKKGLRLFLLLK